MEQQEFKNISKLFMDYDGEVQINPFAKIHWGAVQENYLNGKLFVDATGSIGLEEDHHLADLMAFSSCKGLFGITGASFIAHKSNLLPNDNSYFYFNLETHKNNDTFARRYLKTMYYYQYVFL